jgi:hypothetical protein
VDVDGDGADNVWAVGEHVYHFDGGDWEEVDVGISAVFNSVSVVGAGVWLGAHKTILERRGPDWVNVFPDELLADYETVNDIEVDAAGNLYLTTQGCCRTSEGVNVYSRLMQRSGTEWEEVGVNLPTSMTTDEVGVAYVVDARGDVFSLPAVEGLGSCPPGVNAAAADGTVVVLRPATPVPSVQLCQLDLSGNSMGPGEERILEGVAASSIARVANAIYLLGEDNRVLEGGDWVETGWTLAVEDGWGTSPDNAWFVGDFGIATFDGTTLEMVVAIGG